jgi:hypothetical protein
MLPTQNFTEPVWVESGAAFERLDVKGGQLTNLAQAETPRFHLPRNKLSLDGYLDSR